LEWGHPGNWIPLIQLSGNPWPFVLMEHDQWPPMLLTWLEQLLWGRARCRPLCRWMHPSPAVRTGPTWSCVPDPTT
jgi:hypothetical protein